MSRTLITTPPVTYRRYLRLSERLPAGARYIYRYDTLGGLFKQRREDPVLRARQCEATGHFPHWQVRQEHARLKPGSAVYRMSYWLSLDIALREAARYQDGERHPVFQRVRIDHPFIESMRVGTDEYLWHKALLFWRTDGINELQRGWSPTGIPHDDIEVLHDDGSWGPMDGYRIMRVNEPCISSLTPSALSARGTVRFNLCEDQAGRNVMLMRERQVYGCALGRPPELAELLSAAIHLPGAAAANRWIYVWETPDRLHGQDVTDMVVDGRGRLQLLLARLELGCGAPAWRVRQTIGQRGVSDSELTYLYERLGLSDLLASTKTIAERLEREAQHARPRSSDAGQSSVVTTDQHAQFHGRAGQQTVRE